MLQRIYLVLGIEVGSPVSIRKADSASAATSGEEPLHRRAGTVAQSSAVPGFLVCVSHSLARLVYKDNKLSLLQSA